MYTQTLPNNIRTVSGTVTVYEDDYVLLCDTSVAPVIVNLDVIASPWNSQYKLIVVDKSSNAAANNITINAAAGNTINGASSVTINQNKIGVTIEVQSSTSYSGVFSNGGSGGSGSVTSVQASGGTTGMLFSGGPITTAGTLTLSGVLIAVNGGTGISAYTKGDLLVAVDGTTLVKLPIGTNNFVLVADSGQTAGIKWAAVPYAAPPYFYAKKLLTTSAAVFSIPPVSSSKRSVIEGQAITDYSSEVESGLVFDSPTGIWTVSQEGKYSVNAKFTTRINTSDINSKTGGSAEVWQSTTETGQLGIAVLIRRGGTPDFIVVCSNKQTIDNRNISDVNIECSSLFFDFLAGDLVYVVVFNKTEYTIVNLAVTSGLPDCFIDFSVAKFT